MIRGKSIVYLGNSGFPQGLAEVQKMVLISKSLILSGNSVTVICVNGIHNKTEDSNLEACGIYENISYIYSSGSPFRSNKLIKRNLLKIKGFFNQIYLLKRMKKDHKLDYAILSTHNFYSVLVYFFLSKIFKFKTILNYVEYFSGVKKNWLQLSEWLNDELYDKYAPKLVDAIFPISEFLIEHIKKAAPGKKYLKIPVLTDFDRFNDLEILGESKYFLFCGAANYKEIVQFIINSFEQVEEKSVFLYLIINGNEGDMIAIKKYIQDSSKKEKIRLFSKLTERELNHCYINARALLIPLRPTVQDKARFPHKIGEYLATGNPVISTNYGEVNYYFEDMENMLIADGYDTKLFAEKMQFVIDKPDAVRQIGLKGKNMALPLFHYRSQAKIIDNFLDSGL